MHDFKYKNSELYAEGVPVREIAEKVGTPVYIYSHNTLLRHLNAYKDAFDGQPHIICFALKANSNPAVLRTLAKNGSGADVVSGGELYLALKAGIPAKKIVYAGVGKTDNEIAQALKAGILMFNVESSDEMAAINRVAGSLKVKAPIALRVNPDIDPKTHPYISTGLKESKFGIPIEKALENYRLAKKLPNLEVVGIHKHIGSQITTLQPFVDALKKVIKLINTLRDEGIEIKNIDIGGGLGIPYNDEHPPHPKDLSKAIQPLLKDIGLNIILEPGRSIAGNAGIFVTKVLYKKKHPKKEFVIVDGGMNDLLRPSLYSAFHNVLPLKKNSRKKTRYDIVGPICESGDFLAKERELNSLSQGEMIAVMSTGAYGFTMSSNYNSRPRVAEVMVKGGKFYTVREREKYRDLVRGTKVPDFLK
ncbi:diaminopimelate decarboxylase [bacterium BMS3Bbin09]|nr:diaminopimelate decarboxylase [bacterium BMS3Bbin09]HDN94892.1 diaminopimelate decarboxylase [Nitrospirota bacterium]